MPLKQKYLIKLKAKSKMQSFSWPNRIEFDNGITYNIYIIIGISNTKDIFLRRLISSYSLTVF